MNHTDGRRALILDLDFTLLHLEAVPGSIEVPGRTRSAYVAPTTIELLRALQDRFAIILATARSWDGARPVSDGLEARGVWVAGAIVEDGALLRQPEPRPLEGFRNWNALRVELDSQRTLAWPRFEWQRDFSACLVARSDSGEQGALLMAAWAPIVDTMNQSGHALRLFRDGRKVYVAGLEANKWSALRCVLGSHAPEAAGVGDGANDVCWLSQVALPCTLGGAAPQVLATVRARGGFVSEQAGHAGIGDVLAFLLE